MHHLRFNVSIPSENYLKFKKSKPEKFRKSLALNMWTESELKERAFRTSLTKRISKPFSPCKKKVFRGKPVKNFKFNLNQ